MLHILTSMQHTRHWKKSRAVGPWKSKLLNAALLSNTMLADAAHHRDFNQFAGPMHQLSEALSDRQNDWIMQGLSDSVEIPF